MPSQFLQYFDRISDREYSLKSPALLYSKTGGDAYLKNMQNQDYSAPFHSPTIALYERASEFVADLQQIAFVDLGPGYPDKAIPFVKHLRDRNASIHYIPVDINESFLHLASNAMAPLVDRVNPICTTFEALPNTRLPINSGYTPIFNLGLTVMNFDTGFILSLLRTIAHQCSGCIIVAYEVSNFKAPNELKKPYLTESGEAFIRELLLPLFSDQQAFRYVIHFTDGCIDMGFLVDRAVTSHDGYSIPTGTSISVAKSYRHTIGTWEMLLNKYFDRIQYLRSPD